MSSFQKKVHKAVKEISLGKVSSYKEIAGKSGHPNAWRAVGNILNKNKDHKVPCHRVIRSNGQVGGYAKGKKKKILLLKREGVKTKKGKVLVK